MNNVLATTYNIVFENDGKAQGTPTAPLPNAKITQDGIPTPKKDDEKSVGMAIATNIAQRSLSYTTSRIGEWAGDNNIQASVNSLMGIKGYAVASAANPVLGAVAIGLDIATSIADKVISERRDQRRILFAQSRTGMSRNN